MRLSLAIVVAAAGLPNWASGAFAQTCEHGWTSGPLLPDLRGADGPVHAVATYDPPGPQGPLLIVGGEFTRIGNIAANHIASWNGSVWRPLGSGTDGDVYALLPFNGNLIVAGNFDNAGAVGAASRHVVAWTGTEWLALSSGLGTLVSPANGEYINNLAVYNGHLIASGAVLANSQIGYVFRLNGTTWENISHPQGNRVPEVLEVFDEDGPGPLIPLLYCDCYNQIPVYFQRWSDLSMTWQDFQPAPFFFRYASTVTNDGLVVAGNFPGIETSPGVGDNSVVSIGAFDGHDWHAYGTGVTASYQQGEAITAVRQFGSNLYIAGNFNNAGGTAVANMARWNGSQWFSTGFLFSGAGYRGMYELRVHNNELIAAGDFNLIDTFGEINHVAKFNGSTWSAFATSSSIFALAAMGPYLVMGGDFGYVDGDALTYDPYYIALWNGRKIEAVSGGVDGPVRALVAFQSGGGTINNIIAGGDFTQVGTQGDIGGVAGTTAQAFHVAQWSSGLTSSGWQPMGDGFNNSVLALERTPDGTIIAGGQFNFTGANPVNINRVARWSSSTQSWASMNNGFNNTVRALTSFFTPFPGSGITIVAGGDFTATGSGTSRNRIAQWTGPLDDHNSSWLAMGNGFNSTVYAIERHGSSTYAAGAFTASGATALNHVARWNGSAWVSVGSGLNGTVYALKSVNGVLYAGCEVAVGGGMTVAKWDGTSWTSLEGGVNFGAARTIRQFKTELMVGGDFSKAQSSTVTTPGMARYRLDGLPWIVRQPQSFGVPCRGAVTLSLEIPPGYDDLDYQWYFDDEPIGLGHSGFGSYRVPLDNQLVLYSVTDLDEGAYHVVMSNACGEVTSSSATVTIIDSACPPCPADFVNSFTFQPPPDGKVDGADLAVLLGAWGNGVNSFADIVNSRSFQPPGDGNVDGADLAILLGAWGLCD